MEQIEIIESKDLDLVVKESGLEIQEAEKVKENYIPFLSRLVEIREQAVKINYEKPVEIDEEIARKLRLKTVSIRTDAEKLKNDRKRTYLLRGNLEQAAYNLIAATCKVAEDQFTKVEKAREIAERERKEAVKQQRLIELRAEEWTEDNYIMLTLGGMSDESYQAYLAGVKKMKEDRAAAEVERLAKIEAERIENERIRKENERLQKEAEEKEAALKAEREKAEKERKEAEEKARKEREAIEEKARKEREAIEEKAKAEREKAEKEAAEKLEAERRERAKIEAELKAKQDAEKTEADRMAKEEAARIAAENKAAKAPDKDKLRDAITNTAIPFISLQTKEGMMAFEQIKEKFDGFKNWANQIIETL